MKTWFITGASRGLGLEIARAALEAGDSVAATSRHTDQIVQALPGFAIDDYAVLSAIVRPSTGAPDINRSPYLPEVLRLRAG